MIGCDDCAGSGIVLREITDDERGRAGSAALPFLIRLSGPPVLIGLCACVRRALEGSSVSETPKGFFETAASLFDELGGKDPKRP